MVLAHCGIYLQGWDPQCSFHGTVLAYMCMQVMYDGVLVAEGPSLTYNTLRPRQNCCHFADIFKCISLNEKARIFIKISLKFVLKEPINNIPALVQIMAWRRLGDKQLSEPMVVSLLTHIFVTRPQ